MVNIICSTYFRSKRNPQAQPHHQQFIEKDSYLYMKPWYDSINKLKLSGIIFYDDLSKSFLDKYTTEYVSFVKYEPKKYSLNDARFYAYKEYIENNHVDNIFMTDLSDVIVKKNPFEFIDDKRLYVGSDLPSTPYFGSNQYLVEMAQKSVNRGLLMSSSMLSLPCCNAGVIGGTITVIRKFLEKMCETFDLLDSDDNHNMTVLHYVIDKYFRPIESNLFTGNPLTSDFRKNDIGNQTVYFVHK